MRKTFALFLLPGQPNQALNHDAGWSEEEEEDGGLRAAALLELDFLLIKSRVRRVHKAQRPTSSGLKERKERKKKKEGRMVRSFTETGVRR